MEVHLLLVNLPYIKNLVDEIQNALGIAVDDTQVFDRLLVKIATTQLFQGTHDESQWRADVVSSIDEELHLVLIHALTDTTAIHPTKQADKPDEADEIDRVGQRRAVPRCTDHDGIFARCRRHAIVQGSHFEMVGATRQMVQADDIAPDVADYPLAAVQSMLKHDVGRVGIVEQREFQGERVVQIADSEMVALGYWFLSYLRTIRLSKCGNGVSADIEPRELQMTRIDLYTTYLLGSEGGKAVSRSKEDAVIIRMQASTNHIFATRKARAADVAHPLLLVHAVVPDTHRGRAPVIAGIILHDVAHR